uniref:Germinal center associated signaling and motility n=1 Tax=Chinchilla lanigera TaxID=34839 RepID=A0A8C2VZA2_CHILA
MGNFLQRENRCWDHHIVERCFCFPWKRIRRFKTSQDSQKENKGTTSSPNKDNGNKTYMDEVCYILINHTALGRNPSGNSAEEAVIGELYENVSYKANRPRESVARTETEYSLLRVPSTPRHPPCPEHEYELLMPSRTSPSSLQQPRPRVAPFETQFSVLQ